LPVADKAAQAKAEANIQKAVTDAANAFERIGGTPGYQRTPIAKNLPDSIGSFINVVVMVMPCLYQ
jgi:hypothetical protein